MAAAVSALLAAAPGAALARPPRLALVVVIDQLGMDLFLRAKRHLSRQGMLRLWDDGTRFLDATYGYAATYTGPGHACLLTGTDPAGNGIVGNRYFDRSLGRTVPILSDPGARVLGAPPSPEDDSSPAHLVGETVGDRLRISTDLAAQVVAIALKDRAAVTMGGRLGQAFWFSPETGRMVTSTHYAEAMPAWADAFNARRLTDEFFGRVWDRALPESEYPPWDAPEYEVDAYGLGRAFPHRVAGTKGTVSPSFYAAFQVSPFAIELEVAFARAAIDALRLGDDDVTDLLLVSFTSTDYIGHSFGPNSQEALDAVVRVDQAVAALLRAAEAAAGRGHVLAILAADHGVSPMPEFLAPLGVAAGRIRPAVLQQNVARALAHAYGPGDWVAAVEDPSVYLDRGRLANQGVSIEEAERVAAEAARRTPGVLAAWTRSELRRGSVPDTPLARAALRSFQGERSGEVIVVAAPFHFFGTHRPARVGGTSHGTPYRYDAQVPLAIWGPGVPARAVHRPVDMADVAPTLAALLGIGAPATAEGEALPEVFP